MYLKQFRQDPFPVFVYEVDGLELEKSVFMVHGENTTVVQYELRGAVQGDCTLELRPLIAFRDYHSTTHENGALNPSLEIEPGPRDVFALPGLPESLPRAQRRAKFGRRAIGTATLSIRWRKSAVSITGRISSTRW